MSVGATAQPARGLCFNELYCPFSSYFFIYFFLIQGGKFPASGEASLRHPARAWAPCSPLRLLLPLISATSTGGGGSWGGLGFQRRPHTPRIHLSSGRGMTWCPEGVSGARDVGLWACETGCGLTGGWG